jgi:FdrA protein
LAPGTSVLIRKDSYHDSVLLMRLSRELASCIGADQAHVVMGTRPNLDLLRGLGFAAADLAGAGPNDLVIALSGSHLQADRISAEVDRLLASGSGAMSAGGRGGGAGGGAAASEAEHRPNTLAAAVAAEPDTDLILISIPGQYAAREARRALALGRHVMLFSDNVTVADEVALKQEAARRGLLMMGPDCGTAIINGKPLGFANVVQPGEIGIVGASGTGIQEISCCIDDLGGGISQAIGTGGRDLGDEVGGIMTLMGIQMLAADPRTRVIVVVSKPPSPAVASKVLTALEQCGKPGVAHFVGAEPGPGQGKVEVAGSLAEAAAAACRLAGVIGEPDDLSWTLERLVLGFAAGVPERAGLRGLFCGGTTAAEAMAILTRLGFEIRGNLHGGVPWRPEEPPGPGHLVLDLGDDVFTRGRPHPMIEPDLRNERLLIEATAPDVGLLLFDLILGHGSHPDPAGVLAAGVERARRAAGRNLIALASVTGTDADPQDAGGQRRILESAGITVLPDNRTAAMGAAALLIGRVP